jgi:hypothetical protein
MNLDYRKTVLKLKNHPAGFLRVAGELGNLTSL